MEVVQTKDLVKTFYAQSLQKHQIFLLKLFNLFFCKLLKNVIPLGCFFVQHNCRDFIVCDWITRGKTITNSSTIIRYRTQECLIFREVTAKIILKETYAIKTLSANVRISKCGWVVAQRSDRKK